MNTTLLKKRFRDYLYEAGLKPGEKLLPELDLAKRFQVSRGDIRKVLTVLCHEGILERRPRTGTVIKNFNPEIVSEDLSFRFQMAGLDPADALEARRTIELAILPLVIRRITPSTISRLKRMIEEMEANIEFPELADCSDRDFHLELLRACGNQTLQAFAGVIAGLFHPELRKRWYTKENFQRAIREHRELLESIEDENLEKANAVMKRSLGRKRPDNSESE